MTYADFEGLLRQTMGLDAASIGSSAVERAVTSRLSACKISDVCGYWELVRTSAAELQALIEAVIVPETWFFRDREAFAELARVANEDWLPANPEGIIRLLSLPCSSGEEPYSMAMALLDTAFPPNRYRIDAVDIGTRGLTHARCAQYGKNSFRGADLAFRDRHFETTALGSRLSDAVRQQVHFRQGNLLADDLPSEAETYDIIFCRNLLIYFDRTTQDRAVKVLQRLLKPKGVLFVGASECGLLLSHDFVSSKVPLAFAFRRSGSGSNAIVPAPAQRKTAASSDAHKPSAAHLAKLERVPGPKKTAEPPDRAGAARDEAFRLADQGRMAEAAKCCEKFLREHGPSAQAFFLMGLIRASTGNVEEAGQYYRKALYLDQNHQDSLVHLGLLLEGQGDVAGARILRGRIERLTHKRTA
jgi:chemotaxis protein methyltransferase WspC